MVPAILTTTHYRPVGRAQAAPGRADEEGDPRRAAGNARGTRLGHVAGRSAEMLVDARSANGAASSIATEAAGSGVPGDGSVVGSTARFDGAVTAACPPAAARALAALPGPWLSPPGPGTAAMSIVLRLVTAAITGSVLASRGSAPGTGIPRATARRCSRWSTRASQPDCARTSSYSVWLTVANSFVMDYLAPVDSDGEIVLVELRARQDQREGGWHVLERLRRQPDGRVELVSLNQKYPPRVLDPPRGGAYCRRVAGAAREGAQRAVVVNPGTGRSIIFTGNDAGGPANDDEPPPESGPRK